MEERGISVWLTIGFVALALLLGPVASYVADPFAAAVQWQVLAGGAVASGAAGGGLLVVEALRGRRLLDARRFAAVGLLALPLLLEQIFHAGLGHRVGFEGTRWGVVLLIAVAAPLWLGLLSALQMIAGEVPRVVVGASIAGVGAVLLVIPTDAYAVVWGQVPMLAVRLLMGILTVYAWWFARERLSVSDVLPAAGALLLMNGLVSAGSSLLVERAGWQPVYWREAAGLLLVQAGLMAASYWLWIYLLVRMRLSGFCMHPLAAWVAGLGVGLVGARFGAWRLDVAAVIAVAAVGVGVKARNLDERATVLGLRGT